MNKLKFLLLALLFSAALLPGAAKAADYPWFKLTSYNLKVGETVYFTSFYLGGFTGVRSDPTTSTFAKVLVSWGDGSSTLLPATSSDIVCQHLNHTYNKAGNFVVYVQYYINEDDAEPQSTVNERSIRVTEINTNPVADGGTPNKAFQVCSPLLSKTTYPTSLQNLTIKLRWTGATLPSNFSSFTATVSLLASGVTYTKNDADIVFDASSGIVSVPIVINSATNGGYLELTSFDVNGTDYSETGWAVYQAVDSAVRYSAAYGDIDTVGSAYYDTYWPAYGLAYTPALNAAKNTAKDPNSDVSVYATAYEAVYTEKFNFAYNGQYKGEADPARTNDSAAYALPIALASLEKAATEYATPIATAAGVAAGQSAAENAPGVAAPLSVSTRFRVYFKTPQHITLVGDTSSEDNAQANGAAIIKAVYDAGVGTNGVAAPVITPDGMESYIFQTNGPGANRSAWGLKIGGLTGTSIAYGQIVPPGNDHSPQNICGLIQFSTDTSIRVTLYVRANGNDYWRRLHTMKNPVPITFNSTLSSRIAYHLDDTGAGDGAYVLGNNISTWSDAATKYGIYNWAPGLNGTYEYTLWAKEFTGAALGASSGSAATSSADGGVGGGCQLTSGSVSVLGVLFPVVLVMAGLFFLSRRNRA